MRSTQAVPDGVVGYTLLYPFSTATGELHRVSISCRNVILLGNVDNRSARLQITWNRWLAPLPFSYRALFGHLVCRLATCNLRN